MKGRHKIKQIGLIIVFIFLSFLETEAAMTDYCVTPPFISQRIPPNVLIVLDNSGSMCDQAYAGSYDPTQFVNGLYYGYFDGDKLYKYDGSRWVETTEPITNGTVTNPIATGSFLNWATMRRVEVAKKLLIGGKANPRSPQPGQTVKLDGETSCNLFNQFSKDFNTSAGNLIYPFVGKYRFTRSGGSLTITPLVAGTQTEERYPISDITTGAWVPNAGTTRYTQVDEVTADGDTTYIQNTSSSSNDQVIFGYDKSAFSISGTITSVTVVVRAKKIVPKNQTMRIQGVIRVKDNAGIDADFTSNYADISTTYNNYQFVWTTNPQTGTAWTWNDLTTSGINSLTGFGVKAYTTPTSSIYPRVTQIYMMVTVSNPSGGPYNVIVDHGMVKAEGIIDTLPSDVRFGLAYYNYNEAGHIDTYVGFNTPTNMITSIHNMVPSTWTPLAETLYEMTRYFRQDNPYYSNSPADYQLGSSAQMTRDPYWYKFTDIDPNLPDRYVPCAKSFILFLTDGESTQDQNIPGTYPPASACSLENIKGCSVYGGLRDPNKNERYAGTVVGTTYSWNGTDYMIDVAYWARTNDMRPGTCTDTPTSWQQCLPGNQNVVIYPAFMFGRGSTLLKDVSIYGGFVDLNNNNRPDCTTIPAECYRDSDGDGVIRADGTDDPLTYYEGDDGYALEQSIKDAILAILKRAASGTAVSILASGEGQGANLLQAVFYPKKSFGDAEVSWIGAMQNLWYYIAPFSQFSSIREDTDQNKKLNLTSDYITQIYFDQMEGKTKASRCQDTDGDGDCDTVQPTVDFENLKNLWEAGIKLFQKSPVNRRIYTNFNNTITSFDTSLASNATFQGLLQAANATEAQNIINYVRGTDITNYRSRTVTLDIGGINVTNTWKLADIVHSTPKIKSAYTIDPYFEKYADESYLDYRNSPTFKDRNMVYVGVNDGMLHAIKLGKLEFPSQSNTSCTFSSGDKACLSGTGLGEEQWAFIPKNALPYLKYLMDPDYCHLYYVDATPYIKDVSIGTNECTESNYWDCDRRGDRWRTVLIGSMRLGGACRNLGSTCTNCVKTPVTDAGYSSYFALDITDENNPQLLWEFSHPDLGFSTAGPLILREGPDGKNGRWFVLLASGPTGPIDTNSQQFLGRSDQNLKLFILDLKTGALLSTIDTNIQNAFAGAMVGSALDFGPEDYQDDVVYIPYSRWTGTQWAGGILRFMIKGLQGGDLTNPDFSGKLSTLIELSGPVTSGIDFLSHPGRGELWLFFGTGRYIYKLDDLNSRRRIYGIKEPCYQNNELTYPCSTAISESDLHDATENILSSVPYGWYINLDCASWDSGCQVCAPVETLNPGCLSPSGYGAERVITNPDALPTGVVFFTTTTPTSDICGYGGNTYIWAVDAATGGSALLSALQGKALLQLSTGEIKEIDLSTAFVERAPGSGGSGGGSGETASGRRTVAFFGLPPEGSGLALIGPAIPIDKFLFIKEK